MLVAIDGNAAGVIAVADTLKEESIAAIAALQRLGIDVVMMTGDNRRTAAAIARQVGIGRVLAEVRSEEHTSELQSLMRISYAVFCLKKKKPNSTHQKTDQKSKPYQIPRPTSVTTEHEQLH